MATDTTGVPIKLLHEGKGHVVTVELKNGEVYKGLLAEAEDTMNCQMKEDLLKNATILKKIQGMKAKRVESEGGNKPAAAGANKKAKHVKF